MLPYWGAADNQKAISIPRRYAVKRRNWFLLISAIFLVVSALRSLFDQHSSTLRPPISEAELGI